MISTSLAEKLMIDFHIPPRIYLQINQKTFSNEIIQNCSLDTSFITASNFTNISFKKVDFSGNQLHQNNFTDCSFDTTLFSKAIGTENIFFNCTFLNSNLGKLELKTSKFENVWFYFYRAYLDNFSFQDTKFNNIPITLCKSLIVIVENCQFQINNEVTIINSQEELIELLDKTDSLESSDRRFIFK